MTQRVIRGDANGLCTLTLNRPEKRNALETGRHSGLAPDYQECVAKFMRRA